MNEPSSSPQNNRPRGGRRRRTGGGNSPRASSSQTPSSAKTGSGSSGTTEPPNLIQRVISFFKGAGKKTSARDANSAGGAPNATRNGYGRVPTTGDSPRSSSPARERSRDRERVTSGGPSPAAPRATRRPESIEVTTPRLYVGNLSFDTTESDLTELFNGVGRVVSAEIVTHRQTERSKGFAFVQMTGVDEAKRAVEQLHDKEFMGRKLFLSGAKSTEPHEDRDEPPFAS